MSDLLIQAILAALPGWRFAAEPQGLGWSPLRHLRATLECDGTACPVFIKKCWTEEGRAAESFVCGELSSVLSIRVPGLVAAATIGEDADPWLVLEDLGGDWLDPGCAEDRRAFLRMLGILHEQGTGQLREQGLLPGPLPTFDPGDGRREEWEGVLTRALDSPDLGVEPWMVDVNRMLWPALGAQPFTVLHGDTDVSNALCTEDGYALVDWEHAKIGPVALDLGRAMDGAANLTGLPEYRAAFIAQSGEDLPPERLTEWADLGDACDALKWVCVYVRGYGTPRQPPDQWRQDYYGPCLARLRQLRERRPDWPK